VERRTIGNFTEIRIGFFVSNLAMAYIEAFLKLKFWKNTLEIRGFARL
jgi:hypothetical protein